MKPLHSSAYATSVFHYRHVVAALNDVSDRVSLARRFELVPERLGRMRRLGVPSAAMKILERRAVEDTPDAALTGLGWAQFVPPTVARLPIQIDPKWKHLVASREARHVSRRLPEDTELFQFVSGLGHVALAERNIPITICERRHLHHEVLETDPGVAGDFPFSPRLDPIGEIMQEEYEKSSHIFVYSDIARQSFLSRGYSSARVHVAPLGVPTPMPLIEVERDPHLLIFVGRGDVYKGLDVAVAATEMLGSPYRLVVAGPIDSTIRRWLSSKQHVQHVGILNRTELRALYSSAAALLVPSIESFGYAPIEGACHGARLLCAATTGAREYLAPEAYRLVDSRDPANWAHAVIESAPELVPSESARSARGSVDSLNWHASAIHLVGLYRSIVAA